MSYLDLFKPVRAFVFDVDGVLTNGNVVLLPDGEQMRHMHSKDAYALQLAVKKGYHVAVITGSSSIPVKDRLNSLGVTDVYLKSLHKDESMSDFLHSYSLKPEEVMYMGDDIPDISAMHMIGLPATPADGSEEIKRIAQFVSKYRGGEGCARDIIEQIMKTQGTWYNPDLDRSNLAEYTW